jgi:molybdopterin biosynthesis enzyme
MRYRPSSTLSGRYGSGVRRGSCRDRATQCMSLNGDPLPDGMDAVVMVEYSEEAGPLLLVKRPVADSENVVPRGEDFSKGEKVLPASCRISPREAGVLAAAGCSMVPGTRIPVIGIISTGNELIPVDQVPPPGFIRDLNSYLCEAFTTRCGAISRYYPISGMTAMQSGQPSQLLRTNAMRFYAPAEV